MRVLLADRADLTLTRRRFNVARDPLTVSLMRDKRG